VLPCNCPPRCKESSLPFSVAEDTAAMLQSSCWSPYNFESNLKTWKDHPRGVALLVEDLFTHAEKNPEP
jgi:hypothetical protein